MHLKSVFRFRSKIAAVFTCEQEIALVSSVSSRSALTIMSSEVAMTVSVATGHKMETTNDDERLMKVENGGVKDLEGLDVKWLKLWGFAMLLLLMFSYETYVFHSWSSVLPISIARLSAKHGPTGWATLGREEKSSRSSHRTGVINALQGGMIRNDGNMMLKKEWYIWYHMMRSEVQKGSMLFSIFCSSILTRSNTMLPRKGPVWILFPSWACMLRNYFRFYSYRRLGSDDWLCCFILLHLVLFFLNRMTSVRKNPLCVDTSRRNTDS